jgi:FHS family L-fucose permease-like MFS transporter
MPYLIIAGVVLFVAFLFALTKMPEISTPEEKHATFKGITRHRHLVLGVLAQFFYVGAQASLWGYFVDLKLHYAKEEHLALVQWIYRISENMTPTQIAGYHASFGFILFMAGRFVGTWLLTKFPANKLLTIYAAMCALLLTYAWLGSGMSAVVAILVTYFFMSIMFPTIFALSIKNLGEQVKIGSGLVIMAIVGGAVLPPLAGLLSLGGLQHALIVPILSFLIILYFGISGYKVKTT